MLMKKIMLQTTKKFQLMKTLRPLMKLLTQSV